MIEEEEFDALKDRVAELEGLYEELRKQMTPDKIGALVEEYVNEYARRSGGARG